MAILSWRRNHAQLARYHRGSGKIRGNEVLVTREEFPRVELSNEPDELAE
jgi:hypothetical protein